MTNSDSKRSLTGEVLRMHVAIMYVCVCVCRLELWPGFVTSILQYEKNIMLGLDISHKILRTDTVYDYMNDVYMTGKGDFHDNVTKGLVGEIVLTR